MRRGDCRATGGPAAGGALLHILPKNQGSEGDVQVGAGGVGIG